MPHSMYKTSIITLVTLFSIQVNAAERVSLNKLPFSQLTQTIQLHLSSQLQASPTADALQLVSQHTDKQGIKHIRMQQQYWGFPVMGGDVILHSAYSARTIRHQTNVRMNGVIYRQLENDLGVPHPHFAERSREALVHFKQAFPDQAISEEQVTPLIYINEQQRAIWAYRVSLFIQPDDEIPKRPTAILDAETFKPLEQWNDLKTMLHLSPVKGTGFGGNKRVGEYQFGKQLPPLDISRNDYVGRCYLENERVKVVDMEASYGNPGFTMEFDCLDEAPHKKAYWTGYQGNGYDRVNDAYSPSNDALYFGGLVIDMYKNWYGVNALVKQEQPMQLVMRVHFGKKYENAFWDGRQMTFGDGDMMMYPLVSLGVSAHEVSHGFTEQHSNLDYFGQSGGMNEAFSDMAAQAAEYYAQGKASWKIAAEVLKEGSALRFMDQPSRDGQSIDNAEQYRKGLNVHASSGVYNRLFYILANQPGWNPRIAFQVMMVANMDYWTQRSSFSEGACGVLYAAEDLELPVKDVKKSLREVLVKYEEC